MLIKPRYLNRFRHVATVLIRYGFEDVLDTLNLRRFVSRRRRRRKKPPVERSHQRAHKLREALEELGATYIKLGQLLSTRPDILPYPYLQELARLQDRVEPLRFREIRKAVESALGRPLDQVFESFERKSVASASLAQVHRATLMPGVSSSSLKDVAVKVLKPGVDAEVELDLEILREVSRFVARSPLGRHYDFPALALQLERTLTAELDLVAEARNADRLREALLEFGGIRIPEVCHDLTRQRLLVSEYIEGSRVEERPQEPRRPALAEELWRAYLKQMLVDGAFHCDPHPGNLLIDRQGRIVILDHGMVAYLSRETQIRLMALLIALVERDGDRSAEACIDIGIPGRDFRERPFKRDVGDMVARYSGLSVGELSLGSLVLELLTISIRHDIQIPPEMMLLGKTLLNLEPLCRQLDPAMDPVAIMRDLATSLLREQITRDVSPQRFLAAALELRSFFYEVPSNLRRVLSRASSNEFRLGIQIDRSEEMQAAVQKVANRITLGLITAALIVGSAMLFNVDAGVKLWGYPVFALVGFVLAAGLGLYLVAKIMLGDRY